MANNLEGYSDLLYENIVSLARCVGGDCWMGLGLDLTLAIDVPYEVIKLLDVSITCLKAVLGELRSNYSHALEVSRCSRLKGEIQ